MTLLRSWYYAEQAPAERNAARRFLSICACTARLFNIKTPGDEDLDALDADDPEQVKQACKPYAQQIVSELKRLTGDESWTLYELHVIAWEYGLPVVDGTVQVFIEAANLVRGRKRWVGLHRNPPRQRREHMAFLAERGDLRGSYRCAIPSATFTSHLISTLLYGVEAKMSKAELKRLWLEPYYARIRARAPFYVHR